MMREGQACAQLQSTLAADEASRSPKKDCACSAACRSSLFAPTAGMKPETMPETTPETTQ